MDRKYKIHQLLKERGINLMKFAIDMNMHYLTASMIVSQKIDNPKSMSSDRLKKIANYLSVSMEELFNEAMVEA